MDPRESQVESHPTLRMGIPGIPVDLASQQFGTLRSAVSIPDHNLLRKHENTEQLESLESWNRMSSVSQQGPDGLTGSSR